jgi:hypothetical protein
MSETPATNLYTALLAAQAAMGPVLKDANNPAFRTKYASLTSVLDTVTGPLAGAGLLLVQRFAVDAGGPVLVTEIIHAASGQSLTSTVPITCKDPLDPQKMGGAITYYRRYSLLALLGLVPEDDDGNAASKPAPANAPQTRQVAPYAPELREPPPAPAPPAKEADWNDVWKLAKSLGINDRQALQVALGANPGAMDCATIVRELGALRDRQPAGLAG